MATSHNNICTTCDHNELCALSHNGFVWDCSEFQVTIPQISQPTIQLSKPSINEAELMVSICQTCDLINSCGWYKEHSIIFHCEHYE